MLQPARLSSGITSWVKLGAAHALPDTAASQMAVVVKQGSVEDFMTVSLAASTLSEHGEDGQGKKRPSWRGAFSCNRVEMPVLF